MSETLEDPEWEPDDIEANLEWQREQNLLCSCGNPIDESTNFDLRTAWIAEPVICWACAATERAANPGTGKQLPQGTKFRTRRRDPSEARGATTQ